MAWALTPYKPCPDEQYLNLAVPWSHKGVGSGGFKKEIQISYTGLTEGCPPWMGPWRCVWIYPLFPRASVVTVSSSKETHLLLIVCLTRIFMQKLVREFSSAVQGSFCLARVRALFANVKPAPSFFFLALRKPLLNSGRVDLTHVI